MSATTIGINAVTIGEIRRWSSNHSREYFAIMLAIEIRPMIWSTEVRCLVLDGNDAPGASTRPGELIAVPLSDFRMCKRIA